MLRLSVKILNDEFVLHGAGRPSGLQGCQRKPTQILPDGSCQEKLDLILQGSSSQTSAVIRQLQVLIERVRLGHEAWLTMQPDDEELVYQSRLFAADFQWILGSVQARGMGLRLELQRENFWQLPWTPLPLSNGYGSEVTDGLRIDNRADSGGENWCSIDGSSILGDLPAPVRLHLLHDLVSGYSLDQVVIGWGRGISTPLASLEGEMADSLLNFGAIMNSNCHAGAYGLVQWDSTDAIRVMSWVLPGNDFTALSGRQLRPLVRLVNPAGLRAETWISWKLYHGSLVFQSSPYLLALDRELQALPMVCLPVIPQTDETWSDLRLELHVQNRNAGTTHLALDAVFLFFSDGWRQFQALEDGELAFGQTLIDQCDLAQPYIHIAQSQKNQHAYQVLGNGLWLLPGEEHLLQILVDTGLEMPLGLSYHLKLEYQPRRRMLP